MIAFLRQCAMRWTVLAVCLLASQMASAHALRITDIVSTFTATEYQMTVRFDVDALMAQADPDHMKDSDFKALAAMSEWQAKTRLEAVRKDLREMIIARFDDVADTPQISIPEWERGIPAIVPGPEAKYAQRTILIAGRVPSGAKEFVLETRKLGISTVRLWKDHDETSITVLTIPPDSASAPYPLTTPAPPPTRSSVMLQYTVLGFEHILPMGLDHILFVLGLFLIMTRPSALLWQVTAFTVAHSITLIGSMYGVVSLPSALVETVIALSIAYVGVENIVWKEMRWWRPFVVFTFGLLHGMGFAGALREVGLPETQFLPALITFNVGVELGQLAVVGLAFLAVGWFRKKDWYRQRIVIPASAVISVVALYWTVTRAWEGMFGGG